MKYLLVIVIAAIFISCKDKRKSPREMNGKTFLRTADSVYYISFKIDSVIAMEYEPKVDPE